MSKFPQQPTKKPVMSKAEALAFLKTFPKDDLDDILRLRSEVKPKGVKKPVSSRVKVTQKVHHSRICQLCGTVKMEHYSIETLIKKTAVYEPEITIAEKVFTCSDCYPTLHDLPIDTLIERAFHIVEVMMPYQKPPRLPLLDRSQVVCPIPYILNSVIGVVVEEEEVTIEDGIDG